MTLGVRITQISDLLAWFGLLVLSPAPSLQHHLQQLRSFRRYPSTLTSLYYRRQTWAHLRVFATQVHQHSVSRLTGRSFAVFTYSSGQDVSAQASAHPSISTANTSCCEKYRSALLRTSYHPPADADAACWIGLTLPAHGVCDGGICWRSISSSGVTW